MEFLKFNGVKKAIIILCLTAMLTPLAVSAYSIKTGDSVYLPKNEIIEGNLYAAGANLTVEGQVTGDVICAGRSINISGQVAGDVICAGQSINISGQIGGNLRLASETINFSGQAARNAMILGSAVVTAASSSIGWDLLALGGTFELRGDIGRDLYGYLAKARLAGQVGKNIKLNFGSRNKNSQPLAIASTTLINGDLNYTSDKKAAIENEAIIKGKITQSLPKAVNKKPDFVSLSWWWGNLIAVFSALVLGLVLISFWREQIIKITDLMLNKVSASLGWGILTLLLAPPMAIILLITIIGIPLSLILMALWLIALYLSKILVGVLVGRSLLNSLLPKQKDSLILDMIVGVVIIYLLFALPLLGRPLYFIAILWGLGGIILTLKKISHKPANTTRSF
ncbi:hypothetical protein A3H09_02970 [Candidatus Falkowbacteria bacterium RIFCSPLOWO2_12_FULL_45_13]|uniref:DUF8173 domain-containing protein n=2 Tax=Candidatus Falkowiibacteriota TaxID=1752728 RepID=A0A1F5SAJ3_9BACT|nr:MAG: hypothetical protein A3H66_00145 [Candidatus Falkowbacteria bacterium RIFCSPLOWO2_02_FULL_45_21]OGF30478.1 MAG: hypothetical protein A3H09_02970 [Candidatus Falkowbacteria bacterium RIFCSPLOWO2_12_FULL_45_13]